MDEKPPADRIRDPSIMNNVSIIKSELIQSSKHVLTVAHDLCL